MCDCFRQKALTSCLNPTVPHSLEDFVTSSCLVSTLTHNLKLHSTLFFLPRFFSFLSHQYYQQYYQQFYSQPGMAQQAQAQQGYIQYPSQPAQYVYYPQQPYGLVYIWQPDRAGPF